MSSDNHLVWKKNSETLYDVFSEKTLEWPSLSVEWLPGVVPCEDREGYEVHSLLLGTHTTEDAQNKIHIARVEVPSEDTTIDAKNSGVNIELALSFAHESGEVNRARHCPNAATLIATRGPTNDAFVYDLESVSADPAPRWTLTGGHSAEGFGLSWRKAEEGASAELELLTCANDGTVCLWDLRAAGTSTSTASSSSSSSSSSSVASLPSTSLAPIRTYLTAGGTERLPVGDVAWHPWLTENFMFASVGDDRRLCIWDVRDRSGDPVLFAPDAHKGDVTAVAWAPEESLLGEHVLASGGADGVVKVWDRRAMDKGQATKVLEVHEKGSTVANLTWAPWHDSLLMSGADDGKCVMCDTQRDVTSHPQRVEGDSAALETPTSECGGSGASGTGGGGEHDGELDGEVYIPELFFTHAGHQGALTDVAFSPSMPWLCASVDELNQLHVWMPADDICHPEDEDEEGGESEDDEETGSGNGAAGRVRFADAPADASKKQRVD
jgi:WD40 repeat protein